MHDIGHLYIKMIAAMGLDGLEIPATCVRLYRHGEHLPDALNQYIPLDETVTSCQAVRHASIGHPVLLDLDSIGCIAAAISLGLVDQEHCAPLDAHSRVYTDLMRQQTATKEHFRPPSPEDFTSGKVYACQDARKQAYCLFGSKDSGRYKDIATAQRAVSHMAAIQPAVMKQVFFYPAQFKEVALVPDIIILSLRPVELTRIIQGYEYVTGKPIHASMGALRAVPSDLIAWPYLHRQINVSSYCLGARLLARFEGDRLGMGIPYREFNLIVSGLEQSQTGYPFGLYPGAEDGNLRF